LDLLCMYRCTDYFCGRDDYLFRAKKPQKD